MSKLTVTDFIDNNDVFVTRSNLDKRWAYAYPGPGVAAVLDSATGGVFALVATGDNTKASRWLDLPGMTAPHRPLVAHLLLRRCASIDEAAAVRDAIGDALSTPHSRRF